MSSVFIFSGHGESILKFCLAHSIIKLMEVGVDTNTATINAVNGTKNIYNNNLYIIFIINLYGPQ